MSWIGLDSISWARKLDGFGLVDVDMDMADKHGCGPGEHNMGRRMWMRANRHDGCHRD